MGGKSVISGGEKAAERDGWQQNELKMMDETESEAAAAQNKVLT